MTIHAQWGPILGAQFNEERSLAFGRWHRPRKIASRGSRFVQCSRTFSFHKQPVPFRNLVKKIFSPKDLSLLDPSIKFLAQTTTTEEEAPKERVTVAKLVVTETEMVEVRKVRA
jgi:hypothetical protein